VPRPDQAGLPNAERARIAASASIRIAGYAKARGKADPSGDLARRAADAGHTMSGIRRSATWTLDTAPLGHDVAAANAGFKSVGIRITGRRPNDPWASVIGNKAAIAELRQRAAGAGVRISNVSAYHMYPDIGEAHLKAIIETVAELGSKIFVANSYDPDEDAYVAKLRTLCQLGRSAGIRVAVEFMRYSAVKGLFDAQRVIEKVGLPNAGILIDALHLARSGGTPADIRKVPASMVVFAQLCDGKHLAKEPTIDELRYEARNGRLFPGDGNLPLREFLAALPEGTEIEYEVPRQDFGGLTLDERAKVAFSVFNSYLGN
jgi:sugar phosphate isomerase/epimerase